MVAQANEANNATDETPAKAAPLRALRLAFFVSCSQLKLDFEADEVIIDPRVTKLRLL